MLKKRFGLIGGNISYSFSRSYFTEKFKAEGLDDHIYENFDLQQIQDIEDKVFPILDQMVGLNVTIPYKEEIIPYLDELDEEAAAIGAVNTIKVLPGNRLRGFNTDAYGFEQALRSKMHGKERKALVLGTGGASKAVIHVLGKMGMDHAVVSRSEGEGRITYKTLEASMIGQFDILVNCTPLGTYPRVEEKPDIPYSGIGKGQLLFDLIYNPDRTAFLLEGEKRGAAVINGRMMLEKQADRAWEIWNSGVGMP